MQYVSQFNILHKNVARHSPPQKKFLTHETFEHMWEHSVENNARNRKKSLYTRCSTCLYHHKAILTNCSSLLGMFFMYPRVAVSCTNNYDIFSIFSQCLQLSRNILSNLFSLESPTHTTSFPLSKPTVNPAVWSVVLHVHLRIKINFPK